MANWEAGKRCVHFTFLALLCLAKGLDEWGQLKIGHWEFVICHVKSTAVTAQELSDRLWQFAARIAKVVDALPDTRVGRHVAGQIVRSGIAAAPNYEEARSGESRADFVHKVNDALKELVVPGAG